MEKKLWEILEENKEANDQEIKKINKKASEDFNNLIQKEGAYNTNNHYTTAGNLRKAYKGTNAFNTVDKSLNDLYYTNQKQPSIWDKITYTAKNFGFGAEKGTAGIAQGVILDSANEMQKGKTRKEEDIWKDFYRGYINDALHFRRKLYTDALNESINTAYDPNKSLWEKIVDINLNAQSAVVKANTPGYGFYSSANQLLGKYMNADEQLLDLNSKIEKPLNEQGEKLAEEGKNYDKATNFVANASQSVGNMVPSIAATAITKNPNIGLLTMGASVKGQATQEALNKGMDLNKANQIGDAKAAIEIGTEQLSGGTKIFGKGSMDDIAKAFIKKHGKSNLQKLLMQKGYNALGEIVEEEISNVVGNAIDKGTVDPDKKIIDWQEAGNTAASTVLTTAILNALTGGTVSDYNEYYKNSNQYKDIKTGEVLNDNSQNALHQAEDIINQNSKPNLPQNQTQNGQNLPTQQTMQEQNNVAQNGNMEQILPTQNYFYEKSDNVKVDNLRKDVSKYFDNSEKTHNFVNMLEKIIQDKDIDIRLDENLKDSQGNVANGKYENGVITINPNSDKAGEFIAIHELTHAIGTDSMRNIIENYRKSNVEFDNAVKSLLQNYNTTELTDEAMADVSAQLLGNQEYINNLAQTNPSLFTKIYNEIKYLWHQFTGYKNQNQFLEDLQYKWEQAYKNNNKLNDTTNYLLSGKNSKTANYKNLNKAIALKQNQSINKLTDEDIFKKTGWYLGGEGKWKYEINDKNFKMKNNLKKNGQYWLEDVFDAKELYDAYPDLKFVPVDFLDLGQDTTGGYNPIDDTIVLNNAILEKNSINQKKDILHEIQHAIQNREDFAEGASTADWEKRKKELKYSVDSVDEDIKSIHNKIGLDNFKKDLLNRMSKDENLNYWEEIENFEQKSKYAKEIDELNKRKEKYTQEYLKIKNRDNEELYKNTAGEQEAFNVEERSTYTNKQRKNILPLVKDDKTVYIRSNNSMKEGASNNDNESTRYKTSALERTGNENSGNDRLSSRNRKEQEGKEIFRDSKQETTEDKRGTSKNNKSNNVENSDKGSFNLSKNHKEQQNEIIQKYNPMNKSLGEHTWINSVEDIKTYQEAIEEFGGVDNITPDFTAEDVKKALDTGKVTVYSSYPIEQGTFVTPSKMEAQSYAGRSQVYSKEVNLSDVAWIDEVQGQYAKVEPRNNNVTTDNQGNEINSNMQKFMRESKAKVNNEGKISEDGNLAVVYHTTTDKVAQFNEFNPVGTPYYRFGNQVVNYFTDSKDMSGSYSNNKYKTADTKRLNNINEANNYLKELNNNRWSDNKYYIEKKGNSYYLKENSLIQQEALNFLNNLSNDEINQLRENIFTDEEFKGTPYEKAFSWDKFEKGLQEKYRNFTDKYMGSDNLIDIQKRMIEYLENEESYNKDKETYINKYENEEQLLKNLKQDIQKKDWINNSNIQYEGYVNITNPYIIDAEGKNWDSVVSKLNKDIEKNISEIKSDTKKVTDLINLQLESEKKYNQYNQNNLHEEYLLQARLVKDLERGLPLDVRNDIEDTYLFGFNFDDYATKTTKNKVEGKNLVKDLLTKYAEEHDANDIREFNTKIEKYGNLTLNEFLKQAHEAYNTDMKYGKEDAYFKSEVEKILNRDITKAFNDDFITGEQLYKLAKEGFSKNAVLDILGERQTTNDIVKQVIEMNKNGANYDGVIMKNVLDYGGNSQTRKPANLYVTFASNQFKAKDNLNPTSDADIRYSKNNQNWQEYLDKNIEPKGTKTNLQDIKLPTKQNILPMQLENKQQTEYNTNESESGINGNENDTKGTRRNVEENEKVQQSRSIERLSKENRTYYKEYQEVARNSIAERIRNEIGLNDEISDTIYEKAQQKDNITLQEIYDLFDDYRDIEIATEGIDEDRINEARKYIRNTKLDVSELKRSITDYNSFRKSNFGKLNIGNDGMNIDSFYQELSNMYPDLFDSSIYNVADQIEVLSDFMNNKDRYINSNEIYRLSNEDLGEIPQYIYNILQDQHSFYDDMYNNQPKVPIKETSNEASINLPTKGETVNWNEIERPEGKIRKHYKSIIESSNTTAEAKAVARELMGTDTYVPESNKSQIQRADKFIEKYGVEKALDKLITDVDNDTVTYDGVFKKVGVDDIALGERLIQYYSKTGDSVNLQNAIQATAAAGTYAGRAVQALSMLNHQTPTGQVMWIQRSVDKMNQELVNKRGENAQQFDFTPEMQQKIMDTNNQEEMYQAINEVYDELGQQVSKSKLEQLDSWRYFSMLANPKTHIRNIVGNVAMGKMQTVKNKVAGAIEGAVAQFNPDMERTHTLKRASKEVKQFAKNDIKNVADRLELNQDKYNPKSRLENSMRTFKSDTMENTLGKAFKLNEKALEVEDAWGLKSGYVKALSEYMTANNITPDTITDAQLAKARNYAIAEAKEATFHAENAIATAINQFSKKGKSTKLLTDATLPFVKTPMNVAKAGMEYNPTGLIKTLTYDTVQLRKGNISVNKYIDNLSKGLTGTGIAVLGYALAEAGILKASGGDDDKKEKFDEAQGKQAYSIQIGDKTYSLDWLAPAGIPLFVGAEANAIHKAGQEEKSGKSSDEDKKSKQITQSLENWANAMTNSMSPMAEMSMISGITSALKSYNQDSTQMLGQMGTNAVKSYVNQFVPTALGQVARTTDKYERSTTSTAKGIYSKAIDQTKLQVMSKIPGLRQQLPVKTDVWGKEQEQEGNIVERAIKNSVLPFTIKSVGNTKVDKELNDLYNKTGETSILPNTSLDKTLTISGEKHTMNNEEFNEYKTNYGKTSYKLLDDLISSKGYNSLSDSQKQKAIENIYSYAKEKGKIDYAKENNLEVKPSKLYKTMEDIKSKGGNQSSYLHYLSKTSGEKKESEKNKILADANYSKKTKEIIYSNGTGKDDKFYNTVAKNSNLDIDEYLNYKLQKFEADKNENGQSISGTAKKEKTYQWVNQNISNYEDRLLILGNLYKLSNQERNDLTNYINQKSKTDEEAIECFKQLTKNYTYKNGKIYYK